MKATNITIANDDLELIIKSLESFSQSSISDNQKLEADRIAWILSQVLTPEVYNYSDSQIINY